MKIGDCMKRKVIYSTPETTIQDAARLLVQYHIGSLPIVNDDCRLIGLVRIRDLVTLVMPDFIKLIEDLDFVHDFGAVEDDIPEDEVLKAPIKTIMHEPVSVEESAGLSRAIAILQEHKMNDLPIVTESGRLVGIASYVDISVAMISNWS